MSIYVEKHPQECTNLLKYGFTVRELGSAHGDAAWRFYDENFRKLRQLNLVPGNYLSQNTFLRHQQSRRLSPFVPNQNPKPAKFCYNFNNGYKCKSYPCPYQHVCQTCKQLHPRVKCHAALKPDKTVPTSSVSTRDTPKQQLKVSA
jgi:hypothetical protein